MAVTAAKSAPSDSSVACPVGIDKLRDCRAATARSIDAHTCCTEVSWSPTACTASASCTRASELASATAEGRLAETRELCRLVKELGWPRLAPQARRSFEEELAAASEFATATILFSAKLRRSGHSRSSSRLSNKADRTDKASPPCTSTWLEQTTEEMLLAVLVVRFASRSSRSWLSWTKWAWAATAPERDSGRSRSPAAARTSAANAA